MTRRTRPLVAVYYQNFHDDGPGHLKKILKKRGIRLVVSHAYKGDIRDIRKYDLAFFGGAPLDPRDQDESTLGLITQIAIALEEEIPLFGICRGLQLLILAAQGKVEAASPTEWGMFDAKGEPFTVTLTPEGQQDRLLKGLEGVAFRAFQMHQLMVRLEGVANVSLLGVGEFCTNQVVKVGEFAYGFQSHLEFSLKMMQHFMKRQPAFYGLVPRSTLKEFRRFYKEYLAFTTLVVNNFVDIAEERRRQRQRA